MVSNSISPRKLVFCGRDRLGFCCILGDTAIEVTLLRYRPDQLITVLTFLKSLKNHCKAGPIIAVLIGSLLLAACGSSQTAGTQTSSHGSSTSDPSLCSSIASLDHLTISRSMFPQTNLRFSFPPNVVVSNATSVRNVARALCVLPKMPTHGTISCPAGRAITYHLAFSAGDRAFPEVLVDMSGCTLVRGVGAIRWVEQSPSFWHTSGIAMGLSSPGYATFRGS